MKVHIKAITLLTLGILVINLLSFGVPVFAVAGPAIGIPVGVGIGISSLPQDIYKGFRDAYKMFIKDIFGLSNSYSYTDYDGNTKTATSSTVEAHGFSLIDSGKVMYDSDGDGKISLVYYDEASRKDRFVDLTLDEFSKLLSNSEIVVDVDDYNGENVVSFYYSISDYDSSIKNVLNDITAEDDHSSIMWDLKHVNGVPQNELVINSPITVPCFDYLGLNYGCTTNFNDPIIDIIRDPLTNRYDSRYNFYYFFVITSDKTLYCLTSYLYTGNSYYGIDYYAFTTNDLGYRLSKVTFGGTTFFKDDYQSRISFRFFENNGKLYPSLYISYNTGGSFDALDRYQYTFGNPALTSMYNLFSDENFKHSNVPSNHFVNIDYSDTNNDLGTYFYLPLNSEYITGEELLTKDISLIGYFGSDSASNSDLLYNSSTMSSVGNLLPTYDTLYVGGSSSITSSLSDLQKAIYILAQQYGERYEELLQKLDMIIDSNGNVTIAGADGIQYSVDQLSKSFDEVIGSMEDISGDLSELLSYLKSLNIEGIEGYISALEGTLGDLNERDKDQTAILGDLSGSLGEIKEYLNTLDLSGVSSSLSSIDQTLSNIEAREQSLSDFNAQFTPMGIYGGMTFHLYDQCKYFLDNLFNYNDRNTPPNFSFYYDSNGDGEIETYPLIDFSFLETILTNENTVDKSLWSTPIKIIDLIRYIIAIVCYGLFVMRLIKRLPTFYGNGPLSLSG